MFIELSRLTAHFVATIVTIAVLLAMVATFFQTPA